ncbi:uncharacterized protein LOC135468010 isoform X1 [Liolophura sinensis]|uniref:uncharacterized protein LOC135468010 isoform X1 n=1 Tax=Liolophura sinensis TaxID=3198878 RepID=UPI0031592979
MPALSLSKLVDLALGTPEVGAVNFNILHSLLHAMIQHLKISEITADINESDRDFLSGPEKMQLLSSLSSDSGRDDSQDTHSEKSGADIRKRRPPYHQLETKVARLAEQLEQLNALPSTNELFQQIKATGDIDRPTPMADLWKSMQISKRVSANEDGVGKLMSMVEDLMREMSTLKDDYSRMDRLETNMKRLMEENNSLKDRINNLGIEDLLNRLSDLDAYTKELNEKFEMLPSAEDMASYVTWPVLEDALNGVRSDMKELYSSKPVFGAQDESRSRPTSSRTSTRLSGGSSGPSLHTLDILERLGRISGDHEALEQRVDIIEEEMKNKVDKDFLEQSLEEMNHHLFEDFAKQLEQIKTDIANLQNEMQGSRDQMKPVGVIFDPSHGVGSVHDIAIPSKKGSAMLPPLSKAGNLSPVFAESLHHRPGSPDKRYNRIMEHTGNLGRQVSDLENKVKQLQEYVMGGSVHFHEPLEESEMMMHVGVLETASEHELLLPEGPPLSPHPAPQLSPGNTAQIDIQPDIHNSQDILSIFSTSDSPDDGDIEGKKRKSQPVTNDQLLKLGKVFNLELRGLKEKLIRRDEGFKKMEKGLDKIFKKAQRSGASRTDMEALMRAQKAIHVLREDVDKLQTTTYDILQENDTRTKQIESLFQYCDKLQDVKADKEYVEMEVDVKADKRLLEAKVNHSLFESTTDEINQLIQEIQDKLNGNAFDWKDAITKLTSELESKLDRMELKSLKEWLESRLKALNQKIKQSSTWEDDDAAGLRKQLLQRFHCISCDRPVDIMMGGPVPSVPGNNGLPGTRSPRPYTTYELDQIRQHAKSHVIGRNAGNYERALAQREMAKLRKTDTQKFMLQQYQQSEACHGDVDELAGQETSDFYAPDRPCGGSHTLTYPHKRVTKMSHLNHLFQNEPVIPSPAPVAFKHDSELDILGVDGHIYKGRIKKQDPSRRYPLAAAYQAMAAEERNLARPPTSAGSTKPTTTPVPPPFRQRPTSAVPRPASGGSVQRINSARLTMRPQSARPSSRPGSTTPSPPPEEPRHFLPNEEEEQQEQQQEQQQELPKEATEQVRAPSPEPVEVPVDTPREESADVEED